MNVEARFLEVVLVTPTVSHFVLADLYEPVLKEHSVTSDYSSASVFRLLADLSNAGPYAI